VLTVAGPGVVAYRWRLNQGPWSDEVPLTNSYAITTNLFADARPLVLTHLSVGRQTVEVLGRNSAGYWQENPTVSRSWAVVSVGEVFVVGGEIATNTVWSPELGEVRVASDLILAPGVRLELAAGTIVRFDPGVGWRSTNAVVQALGTAGAPVTLGPAEAGLSWGPLVIAGTNGMLELRHADLEAGSVEVLDGAVGWLEESRLHDLPAVPIVRARRPGSFTMRRCRVHHYYEILSQLALSQIEDCFFHDISGDGIDLDGARPGSVIRNCTMARGATTNVDAIDIGNDSEGAISTNVVIEACRLRDFPFDKGVSIGEGSRAIVVRDCVIHQVDAGVAVKDSADAELYHNTIAAAAHGLNLYEKVAGQGGGHARAWNNILWGNLESVSLDGHSSLEMSYSDAAGGYPGVGNLDVDPRFRDPPRADYRLAADSPVRNAGRNGADMGARLPVGSSLVDTDGDGLPDPWEEVYDLDPWGGADALEDADADGLNNSGEYTSGTNPRDAGSRLRFETILLTAQGVRLGFDGIRGRAYRIETSEVMANPGWTAWTNLPPLVEDARVDLLDADAGQGARYYRLLVEWVR
jgi:hypothetical protein